MPQWFYNLFWLFSSRVPAPTGHARRACGILAIYAALTPFTGALHAMSMDPAILAIATGYVIKFSRNAEWLTDELPEMSRLSLSMLALTLWLGIFGCLFFAPSLAWVQHGITAAMLIHAVLFGFLIWLHRNDLDGFPWFARGWPSGQMNAANWHIARLLSFAVINEAMIENATTSEWIVGVSLTPLVLHYLFWWTVIATHPFEEDDPH